MEKHYKSMGPYELNEPSHYNQIEWVALVGLAVGHTRTIYWEGYLRYIQIPKVKHPCFVKMISLLFAIKEIILFPGYPLFLDKSVYLDRHGTRRQLWNKKLRHETNIPSAAPDIAGCELGKSHVAPDVCRLKTQRAFCHQEVLLFELSLRVSTLSKAI